MTADTPEPLTAEEEAAERLLNDRSAEYRRGWDDAMNARITSPQLLRAAAAALDTARAAPQADAELRREPGTYRTAEGGIEVIVDVPESASWVEDQFPDEVAYLIEQARSPAAPAGLDVGKAANDVRHGGHHLDSYWEGFNDGVDALEARLRAASQPSEDGPAG